METDIRSDARARLAVIIGAGGIGAACCAAFAEDGYRVLAGDSHVEAARGAVRDLAHDPVAVALDVTDLGAVADAARAASGLGPLGALVYTPGLVMTGAVEATDWALYRKLMAVNLDGAFYTAAAFGPALKAARGSMVLVSSTAGRRGEAGASHYCASKFGLIGLAESLAAEFAPLARVNAVCPGNVDTPMLAKVARDIAVYQNVPEDEVRHGLEHAGAARRLVRPREVAEACLALCRPGLSAVTGATVTVDAGAGVG